MYYFVLCGNKCLNVSPQEHMNTTSLPPSRTTRRRRMTVAIAPSGTGQLTIFLGGGWGGGSRIFRRGTVGSP